MRKAVKRSRFCTSVALCLVLATAGAAHGQQAAVQGPAKAPDKPRKCPVPDEHITIVGKTSSLCFPITESLVTIHVPAGVDARIPENSPIQMDHRRGDLLLHVTAPKGTPLGVEDSLNLVGPGYSATVHFVVSRAAAVTRTNFTLRHQTAQHAQARSLAAAATSKAAKADNQNRVLTEQLGKVRQELQTSQRQLEATKSQLATSNQQREQLTKRIAMLTEKVETLEGELGRLQSRARESERARLIESYQRSSEKVQALVPKAGGWVPTKGSNLQLRFRSADWINGHFVFSVDVRNPDASPFPVADVQVARKTGKHLPTMLLEPTGLEDATAPTITTIRRSSETRIAVAVRARPGIKTNTLNLQLIQNGRPPVVASMPLYVLLPETENQRQRRIWSGQVIVGPRVSFGACSLSSGLDSNDDLKTTTCTGIGAVYVRGVHQFFALGGTIQGGWTGNARFNDVLVGETQGDLSRSAKFFRMQFDAHARFSGGPTIPYFNLGVGISGTSYDSSFPAGEAPDSDIEFASYLALGAGVQYRFGESILVGAGLSAILPGPAVLGESGRRGGSLGIGLHVGYGWNQPEEP